MSFCVLGSPLSPFVRKVITVLQIQGAEFELDSRITPWDLPEGFAELNPLKRIPVLKHGDTVLADSSVICDYLSDIHPQQSLTPTDPYQKAQVAWFEKFADYELSELMTFQAFRLLLLFRVMGRPVDIEQTKATIATKLPPLLDYLDKEIGDKTFLVGDSLTVADIATVSQFFNFEYSGESFDSARWANIARYLQHHCDSEPFAPMLKKERGIVAKMRQRANIDN